MLMQVTKPLTMALCQLSNLLFTSHGPITLPPCPVHAQTSLRHGVVMSSACQECLAHVQWGLHFNLSILFQNNIVLYAVTSYGVEPAVKNVVDKMSFICTNNNILHIAMPTGYFKTTMHKKGTFPCQSHGSGQSWTVNLKCQTKNVDYIV